MYLKGVIIGILFVLPVCSVAQGSLQDSSAAIRKYPDKITVHSQLTLLGNSFLVRNLEGGTDVVLDPVYSTKLGFTAQFRALEIGFGVSPDFLNPDREFQDARVFNLHVRLYTKKLVQEYDYFDQKGFKTSIADASFFFEDFRTKKIGGRFSYVFNNDFSFRAMQSQNEWQVKSAGSFVPRAIAYYTEYKLGSGQNGTADSFDLGLGPGYFYNWVLGDHWLISLGNTTGIGVNFLDEGEGIGSYFLFETIFQGGIGYNGGDLFAGINASYSFIEHGAGNAIRVFDRIYYARFFVGYRFNAPKKWIEKAERVNKKYGWDSHSNQ